MRLRKKFLKSKERIVSGVEQPWYYAFYFTSCYSKIEFLKTIIAGFYMDRIIKLYLLLEKMCCLIGYVVGDFLLIRWLKILKSQLNWIYLQTNLKNK